MGFFYPYGEDVFFRNSVKEIKKQIEILQEEGFTKAEAIEVLKVINLETYTTYKIKRLI
jgi:tRNA A58 N-methylase Trm61